MAHNFSNIATCFPHLRYVACEMCKEYTEAHSGRNDAWAEQHYNCGQVRFYAVAPAGYEPFLDPLEALASLAETLEFSDVVP